MSGAAGARGWWRGSGPVLAGLTLAFLAAFAWQRAHSPFLRIEAERPLAAALAQAHGLAIADVFALRELLGVDLPADALAASCAAFARLQPEMGPELAAMAVAGAEPAVRAALRAHGGDTAAAWAAVTAGGGGLEGARFANVRAKFAARAPARS